MSFCIKNGFGNSCQNIANSNLNYNLFISAMKWKTDNNIGAHVLWARQKTLNGSENCFIRTLQYETTFHASSRPSLTATCPEHFQTLLGCQNITTISKGYSCPTQACTKAIRTCKASIIKRPSFVVYFSRPHMLPPMHGGVFREL